MERHSERASRDLLGANRPTKPRDLPTHWRWRCVGSEVRGRTVGGTPMIDLITSALSPFIVAKTLASQGLAVFPVRSRRPLTKRGFYSATADLGALARLNWRSADGVGIPTGEVSGIDVLDVDLRGGDRSRTPGGRESPLTPHHDRGRDGFAALAQLGPLPSTLCVSPAARHCGAVPVRPSRFPTRP